APERFTLPSEPGSLFPDTAGRCCAGHHKAVVFPLMRRERVPRLLLRRLSFSIEPGHFPAAAARTQHPAPRATTKLVEIVAKNTMRSSATKH
ncbi:MAG: hypothetical protein MUP68_19735, partial [Deltaproteobacteria bacterium]|nr:hypothetical protein [Deltaproteobacteria bacterium]